MKDDPADSPFFIFLRHGNDLYSHTLNDFPRCELPCKLAQQPYEKLIFYECRRAPGEHSSKLIDRFVKKKKSFNLGTNYWINAKSSWHKSD